jgi:hypothetical protein
MNMIEKLGNRSTWWEYDWGNSGNLIASEGAAAIELRGRDWALLKK